MLIEPGHRVPARFGILLHPKTLILDQFNPK